MEEWWIKLFREWLNLKSLWNSLNFLDEEQKRLFAGIRWLCMIFFGIPCAQLAVTVCCSCYKRSKKASKKALAHPKDHLECSLRPIQATQLTPWPFWTGQQKKNPLDFKWKSDDLKPIFHWRSPQFTESLKRLCTSNIISVELFSCGRNEVQHFLWTLP